MNGTTQSSSTRRWLAGAIMLVCAVALGASTLHTARAADDESPLAKQMEAINEGYKALRRTARSGTFDDESIAAVVSMQKHTVEAKALVPAKIAKMSGDAKAKALGGYNLTMAKLLRELATLEIALREGKADDAKTVIDNLALVKKEGHDAYIEE